MLWVGTQLGGQCPLLQSAPVSSRLLFPDSKLLQAKGCHALARNYNGVSIFRFNDCSETLIIIPQPPWRSLVFVKKQSEIARTVPFTQKDVP